MAWLTVFLGAAAIIILRQYHGWQMQGALEQLRRELNIAEGQRSALESDIATLQSQPVLGKQARALGLRTASDRELIQIPIPERP